MSSGFKKTDKKGAPVPEINQPAAETAAKKIKTAVFLLIVLVTCPKKRI